VLFGLLYAAVLLPWRRQQWLGPGLYLWRRLGLTDMDAITLSTPS